jgi:hypothetical protein
MLMYELLAQGLDVVRVGNGSSSYIVWRGKRAVRFPEGTAGLNSGTQIYFRNESMARRAAEGLVR